MKLEAINSITPVDFCNQHQDDMHNFQKWAESYSRISDVFCLISLIVVFERVALDWRIFGSFRIFLKIK